MVKKIEISLEKDSNEEYRKNDNNLAQIRVILSSGEILDNKFTKVELGLTRDAMLGLGTALIRQAYSNADAPETEGGFWHLRAFDKTLLTEVLGVYLEPDSCELIVYKKECNKTVQDYANES